MRIAFSINKLQDGAVRVNLYDADVINEIADPPSSGYVYQDYTRTHGGKYLPVMPLSVSGNLDETGLKIAASILGRIAYHIKDSVLRLEADLFTFWNALQEENARQVVFDGTKWRNVSTMSDSEATYTTGDAWGYKVAAPDEKAAVRRATKAATEQLEEESSKSIVVAAINQWFAAGRPVSKVSDGTAPEVILLSSFGPPDVPEKTTKAKGKS